MDITPEQMNYNEECIKSQETPVSVIGVVFWNEDPYGYTPGDFWTIKDDAYKAAKNLQQEQYFSSGHWRGAKSLNEIKQEIKDLIDDSDREVDIHFIKARATDFAYRVSTLFCKTPDVKYKLVNRHWELVKGEDFLIDTLNTK